MNYSCLNTKWIHNKVKHTHKLEHTLVTRELLIVWKKLLCLPLFYFATKPTLTPTNPSSLSPRQQLCAGQRSRGCECGSCAAAISFHQLAERRHNGVTRPWEGRTHPNRTFPLHLSAGNEGFLSEPALKAACEERCRGGPMFLSFQQGLCNVWFTPPAPPLLPACSPPAVSSVI